MSISEECSYYRNPECLSIGPKLGYCDLGCDRTTCGGDMAMCEKPDVLRKNLLEQGREEDLNRAKNEGSFLAEYEWPNFHKPDRLPWL